MTAMLIKMDKFCRVKGHYVFKGQTIRFELESTEDNGSVTSFVVDDFAIVVEQ